MIKRSQSRGSLQNPTVDLTKDEIEKFTFLLTENTSKAAKDAAILYFREFFSSGEERTFEFRSYPILIKSLMQYLGSQVSSCIRLIRLNQNEIKTLIDATWIITNISCISKEMCHLIVNEDAIQILTEIAYESPIASELRAQAIWALGNIAADCPECKQKCRQSMIIELLGNILAKREYGTELRIVRNVVWCALNIVRGGFFELSTTTSIDLITGFYNTMKEFPNKIAVVKDCLWAIAALADDMQTGRQIDIIINHPELIDYIYQIYHKNEKYHLHGCLRILGNIVTGNDQQTEAVICHPLFYDTMLDALNSPERYLNREAAWICSNVAAGSVEHVEHLFKDEYVYEHIVKGASELSNDAKLQKECLWAIANMLTAASPERNATLVASGIIKVFPNLLMSTDIRIVERSVSCLRSILTDHPHYIGLVDRMNLLNYINESLLEIDYLRTNTDHLVIMMNEHIVKSALPTYTFRICREN